MKVKSILASFLSVLVLSTVISACTPTAADSKYYYSASSYFEIYSDVTGKANSVYYSDLKTYITGDFTFEKSGDTIKNIYITSGIFRNQKLTKTAKIAGKTITFDGRNYTQK